MHVVQAGSLGELWHRIGASESTPPLYYLLTWAWVHAFGDDGAGALRAVSALALVAAVPVAYGALQRLTGRPAALATAALLAVSPLLGWYALDARAYGLLVLTGLLSVWACAAAIERPSTRRLALWALTAACAIWTHWFAAFIVLGEVVALLWLRRDAWRGIVLAGAAALLALVPLVGLLHDQTGDDRAAFIADDGLGGRLEQLARQFGAGVNVPRSWLEAAMLVVALGALTAGTLLTLRRALTPPADPPAPPPPGAPVPLPPDAAAPPPPGALGPPHAERPSATGRTLAPRDGARTLLALAAVGLLVPLALAASGLYDRFNVRNVLFLWPLAAALAAPALLRLRAVPLAALLALGIATSLWTQTDWRYENTDWRSATALAERQVPGAPVVAVTPLGQPVAALYLGRAPTPAPLATRRVELVVEPARSAGSRALQPTDAPLLATLLAAFPQHRETQLHGFRVIELRAPRPVPLDPAQLPGATLFPSR